MKNRFLFLLVLIACGFGLHAQQILPVVAALSGQPGLTKSNSTLFVGLELLNPVPGKIILHWKTDSVGLSEYFIIEHSPDGISFETLGALKVEGKPSDYEISDNAPYIGSNYYRIKYSGPNGQVLYSKIIAASQSTGTGFKFYPNPVDKMLIVQNDRSALILIVNSSGNTLIDKEMQAGVTVINVGALQKGNYFLHVIDKATKADRTFPLLKN